MRVLVVEDERDLADAIAEGLRRDGYAVDVALDGRDALVKTLLTPYDLVCLDLNLPEVDGREVCRQLRARPPDDDEPAPRVLMLTARDAVDDRVAGLDDGADDYVVKPFELAELRARIRALLRRDAGRTGAVVRAGDFSVDTARSDARWRDTPLPLSPKEFALLRYFVSRPGIVLSEDHLLVHVWDENANPFTRTVRVTVMTLRRKLAEAGAGHPIETLVGRGYRFRPEA